MTRTITTAVACRYLPSKSNENRSGAWADFALDSRGRDLRGRIHLGVDFGDWMEQVQKLPSSDQAAHFIPFAFSVVLHQAS